MKIVYYDEVDHEEVLAMNLQAFNWPITEATAKRYMQKDERWMDFFGIYAVERGHTVGQVLPLKIRTRTSAGVEAIGGIAGVTVVPWMARQGVGTLLMDATHRILRENDIRISFLLTLESLVAYDMYAKLGYFDAVSFGAAQKLVKHTRKPKDVELREYRKKDWRTTDEIYRRSTARLLGFVERQPAFINMKLETTPMTRKNIRFVSDDRDEGYIVTSPGEDYTVVREIVCRNASSFNRIMATIEGNAAQKHILASFQVPKRTRNWFDRRGYLVDRRTWARIMATSLDRELTKKKLMELYDFGRTFCMMGLDTF